MTVINQHALKRGDIDEWMKFAMVVNKNLTIYAYDKIGIPANSESKRAKIKISHRKGTDISGEEFNIKFNALSILQNIRFNKQEVEKANIKFI